jgi:hypothetical protein
MSNFDINDEIDKLIEKTCVKLKTQMKSLIARSEKQAIKQYIASQKDTSKSTKNVKNTKASSSTSSKKPTQTRRSTLRREDEYATSGSESGSD